MYWEMWMLFVLFLSLILIPVYCVINFNACHPFQNLSDHLLNFLDIMCLVDIAVTFNCGYINMSEHEIVLERAKVFRYGKNIFVHNAITYTYL